MSAELKEEVKGDPAISKPEKPRSLAIANAGVKTGADFAGLMSAVMSDLIAGDMTPQVGNAVCNAGSKLLKIVEMQHKYGKAASDTASDKVLKLVQ